MEIIHPSLPDPLALKSSSTFSNYLPNISVRSFPNVKATIKNAPPYIIMIPINTYCASKII